MLYNQPYGMPPEVTWGDTPYINGNPTTGTAGSIPPAASIEYPQREIVNVIRDAQIFTPSNGDLHQLSKAIQSGHLFYGRDTGTVNSLNVTLTPTPNGYNEGMWIVCKAATVPTGPCVMNCNAMGAQPLVNIDGSAIANGQWVVGALLILLYDGTKFQLVTGGGRVAGMPSYLQTSLTWYVNGTTGSDTAYDGTSATVVAGTIHGPWATIQHAASQTALYNLNNQTIAINVANGTYGPAIFPEQNGSGLINIIGNVSNPSACAISGVNHSAVSFPTPGTWYIQGFALASTGTATTTVGDPLAGLNISGHALVTIGAMQWTTCNGAAISITNGAIAANDGNGTPWRWSGPSPGSLFIPGSFIFVERGIYANTSAGPPAITIDGGVYVGSGGAFVMATELGEIAMTMGSLVGGMTGTKFISSGNSIVSSGGNGINYFPGTVAGVTSYGGQYI
jgi:hypothetical protein